MTDNPYESPKSQEDEKYTVCPLCDSPLAEVAAFASGMGIGFIMCAVVYSIALYINFLVGN